MSKNNFRKILVNVDLDLIGDITELSGEKNKTKTIQNALYEYYRKIQRDKLIRMEGTFSDE